ADQADRDQRLRPGGGPASLTRRGDRSAPHEAGRLRIDRRLSVRALGTEADEADVAELQLREAGIERTLVEQLVVRADGNDAARIHDDDAIRSAHGREAMRDD